MIKLYNTCFPYKISNSYQCTRNSVIKKVFGHTIVNSAWMIYNEMDVLIGAITNTFSRKVTELTDFVSVNLLHQQFLWFLQFIYSSYFVIFIQMFIYQIMWVSNEPFKVLTAITCTGLLKGILKNRLETVEINNLYKQGNLGEAHPMTGLDLALFFYFVCLCVEHFDFDFVLVFLFGFFNCFVLT